MSTQGVKGIVKSVTSGDTLVLTSSKQPVTGKPAEKSLSLAFLTAPRLRREGDEPYAFQSREFLRRNLVGKEVLFQVLYNVPPSGGREYGIVSVPNGPSVVELVVAEGMAKLRDDAGKRDDSAEWETIIERLKSLENKAKETGKGMWSTTDDGKIDCENAFPSNAQEFLDSWKGKQVDSIIERVISGDRLAVRLMLEPKKHQQAIVLVAGIRAPQTTRTNPDGTEVKGEECGDEARLYVEQRLLQRSVKIELVGLTLQQQLVGHVLHPRGSIAEFILQDGLGRCSDQHSSMLGTSGMARLRGLEGQARGKGLGIWKGAAVKKKQDGSNFEAVVSKIQSADTIIVRNKTGQERKISLSSYRMPPKPENHKDPKVPSQHQAEAKELLRKKLIGKHVHVSIDGKRPATEQFEERVMATVTINNENMALSLIEAGLGTCTRHRRDDDDRSPIWDTLLAAEEAAEKEKRGFHNKSAPPPKPIVDASESEQKAKAHLSYLQRQKRIPAVVDFISSGSRFKLLIPRENVKLTFVLSGIRAPRTARNPSEKSEPFGDEALEYTSRRAQQRDVEVDIEAIDKMNGFIGSMYVNRENIAKGLVEEGLAAVHAYSAEQSGHGPELFAAERNAKEARKGMWHSWTPADDEEDEGEAAGAATAEDPATFTKKQDYKDVCVTNVDESGRIKVQIIGEGTNQLEKLMADFKNFHLNRANDTPLSGPPKVGDIVAARFSEDNQFYRAKVRHVDRENKKVEVSYIDYGNSEHLPFSSLRPLNQDRFMTSKLKAQAVDAVLSFVQFPGSDMYATDAKSYLLEITGNRELVANVDYTEKDGTLCLTLFESKSPNSDASINGDMVAEGLAMVPRKLKPWEKAYSDRINTLREREKEAKEDRRGMWEYGDITADD